MLLIILTFISSSTSNNSTCPGGCALSNCFACYYSYNNLPLPNIAKSCSTSSCTTNGKNENCIKKWGECVRDAYIKTYENVSLKRSIYIYTFTTTR